MQKISQAAREAAERIQRIVGDELCERGAAEIVQAAIDTAQPCGINAVEYPQQHIADIQLDGKSLFILSNDGKLGGSVVEELRKRIAELERECDRLRALLGATI